MTWQRHNEWIVKRKALPDEVNFEALIEKHRGNMAAIARELKVSRGTVANRINDDPALIEAMHQARLGAFDDVETALLDNALGERNVIAQIFYLKTQGSLLGRPYVEHKEVHVGGNVANVQMTLDQWLEMQEKTSAQVEETMALFDDYDIELEAELTSGTTAQTHETSEVPTR